jgi:hypothetical protein
VALCNDAARGGGKGGLRVPGETEGGPSGRRLESIIPTIHSVRLTSIYLEILKIENFMLEPTEIL